MSPGTVQGNQTFRIAAITTSWHHRGNSPLPAHAEVILCRWYEARETDAQWDWPGPRSSITSLYIEQLRPGDAIHEIAREHHIPLADSIDQALTAGGDDLVVDGVMLLAEHGEYPRNELGQLLYPRKEMFDAIVTTFARCGRCVPVFCDKHFSWNFQWAQQMVDTAQRMGFVLFGGSSIPHSRRAPALPDPGEAPPTEVACIYGNALECAGFHAMELAQSYVERRPGGEKGVRQVTAYRDDALREVRASGQLPDELAQAALVHFPEQQHDALLDAAFLLEHADGLRVWHLHYEGLTGWALTVRTEGAEDGSSVQAARTVLGGFESKQGHFARFARVIEDALLANRHPFPQQRTLLATGALAAGMHALQQPGEPLPTPNLLITYP